MKTYILYIRVFVVNLFNYLFVRKNSKHGKFIIIDGGEGAGKDTVIDKLKEKYPQVVFSREPGGTPYAEEIRKVMLQSVHAKEATATTQLLLVSAGRSDHMVRNAEPVISSGKSFVSNRGDVTSFGYQVGGQLGGYVVARLFFQIRKVVYSVISPDLYIILEVDPGEGARRVALRKGEVNHFDERKRDFHERVSRHYRIFGKIFPYKVKFIDANNSREEVFSQVDKIFQAIISKSA